MAECQSVRFLAIQGAASASSRKGAWAHAKWLGGGMDAELSIRVLEGRGRAKGGAKDRARWGALGRNGDGSSGLAGSVEEKGDYHVIRRMFRINSSFLPRLVSRDGSSARYEETSASPFRRRATSCYC